MKLLWDCIYFTLLIRLGSGKGPGPPGQGSSGGLGVCTLGCKERFVSTLKARAKQSPRGGNRDEEAGCSPLTAPSLTPSLPPARPSLHCVLRRRGQSPVAVVASALCPDHRGLPSYGISVEWKEGSGGAGPVALVTALGASRGEPSQRGPGALKEPSVYPQGPVPPRGTARRASSPSPPIKPFHGTAEPLVCQDAARETLVRVINLLATPFPRGQALEERSGVGSESVTNPKWAEAAERRATPATLSPGVRAS